MQQHILRKHNFLVLVKIELSDVQKWEETMPATVYGIKKYLESGLIKGVGFKLADDIWGIGFKTTYGIAEKLGFQKND